MPYQSGGTIKDALDSVASHQYVPPAIQREFEWNEEQVCDLFDSVMQGYPFGEFMFWRVAAENSARYHWYDFVRDYHQLYSSHCPELGTIRDKQLTAVFDGQQRLTAFNIGLRGSMARKVPHKRRNSPDAYPRRVLALDLLHPTEPDEEGKRYAFSFVEEKNIGTAGKQLWFKVSDILTLDFGPDMNDWLLDKELSRENNSLAFRTLSRLHQVIHSEPTMAYYEEKDQNLERVLNMFIRCNSGGTRLSYSNILLSIAVFQWKTLDARRSIHGLVDDMNRVKPGLEFNADFVLKAGLLLTDIPNVGFLLENFTTENMAKLENAWPMLGQALVKTAELVASFGFDSRTIQANNSLLPIAYYLYKIESPQNFETVNRYREEREAIRGWLTRSILKGSGTWSGGAVDTVLTALRQVIRDAPDDSFPVDKMLQVMVQRGRSLIFEEGEIEDLSEMRFTDRRIFPLLTMLFPDIDSRDGSDVDHVFPKSRFTLTRLKAAGVGEEMVREFRNGCERLANLQLLDRSVNNEKRAILPADWLDDHRPDDKSRQVYCERHLLGDVPREITGFMEFYEARRERLEQRITELINTV